MGNRKPNLNVMRRGNRCPWRTRGVWDTRWLTAAGCSYHLGRHHAGSYPATLSPCRYLRVSLPHAATHKNGARDYLSQYALLDKRTAGLTYHYTNMFACKLGTLNEGLWCEIIRECTGATQKLRGREFLGNGGNIHYA